MQPACQPLVWINDHLLDDAAIARVKMSYRVVVSTKKAERRETIERYGKEIEAILTFGSIGISADELAFLPKLRLVQCMGVGHENVDLAATRARGVTVTNARGCNDVCVADHAMALMLGVTRELALANRVSHENNWNGFGRTPPVLTRKRLGIVGLGLIGLGIARRAVGFEMDIAYHNRKRREDVAYPYCGTVRELARRSDYLMICVPGGAETRHMIDASVIADLPRGAYVVNVGRGTVIDTAALVTALREKRIAGAALDVLEGEPRVSPEVAALDNILLTPHIGGISPESNEAALNIALVNLEACFLGGVPLNPV